MADYMDLKEAAVFLDCHPVTLNRMAQSNRIPAYKRMNKWFFKREDLAQVFTPNEAASK